MYAFTDAYDAFKFKEQEIEESIHVHVGMLRISKLQVIKRQGRELKKVKIIDTS